MEQTRKLGFRLILFPLPLQGHINPMIRLANILHSKGFSISIIHTNFNSLDPSKHPHFTFHCIQEELTESDLEASIRNPVAFLSILNIKCVDPFRDCLSKSLRGHVSEEPIVCLISDAVFYFAQSVADSLKLPRMVLRTGGAASLVVLATSLYLRERGYLPIQAKSQLEEPVVEFPPLKIKDLPATTISSTEIFYDLVENMNNEIKASSGVVLNTLEELEQSALATLRNEFSIPIFPIGPFHKYHSAEASSDSSSLLAPDHSVISWLDKKATKSVIYVSFGSLVKIKESEFREIAWGLANSKQPFLWVVRPGLVHDNNWVEALPDGFLESLNGRGCVVKWAPQLQVLAHHAVGVFWTHNGWNSTIESIYEGIPMICTPRMADQKVNARYVSDVWRIGLQLEEDGLERGMVERSIKKLMVEKEGKEIREKIMGLKDKANHCLRSGGSSCLALDGLVSHLLSLIQSHE